MSTIIDSCVLIHKVTYLNLKYKDYNNKYRFKGPYDEGCFGDTFN